LVALEYMPALPAAEDRQRRKRAPRAAPPPERPDPGIGHAEARREPRLV